MLRRTIILSAGATMNRPENYAEDRQDGAWAGWTEPVGRNASKLRHSSASPLLKPALIAAGAAAAAAVVNYRRGRAAERAHPPIGLFLDVDGVAVHYVEKGEGPPLVLLHGNGAMAEDFVISGLLDRLAANHRVIAIDRPGYGYTERPRTRAWTAAAQAGLLRGAVQRLGVQKPVVVGHSWGAIVAMAWALDHEDELAGLVLMSGYYYPTPRRDVLFFAPPGIPVIGDIMRYTISPPLAWLIAPKLVQQIFAPHPVPRRFAERFPLDLSLRPWQLRASAEETGFMIPWAAAHQARYGTLHLPVTIITGDADQIITGSRQSMRLHADIPHSRLRVLPGLGHMIHYFAHDEIAASVALPPGRASERDADKTVRAPSRQAAGAVSHAPGAPVHSGVA
jgi:pimeloyl-ACP methyl ester carboxylesterase